MTAIFTNKDVTADFRGDYPVFVPQGTRLVKIQNGTGHGYAVANPGVCTSDAPGLFKHDSTYYYIWIKDEDVSTVDEIVIQKPTPQLNRFKLAIEIQDAGNLRALAREFVRVVDQAADELQSTKAVWDDAAVTLFVNKFESLCRSEARFSAAYKICHEKQFEKTEAA